MVTCLDILRNVKFQLTLYILGTIAGVAAVFVFWLVMDFLYAATLGGISALYASTLAFEIYFQHNIKDGTHILPLTEGRISLIVKFVLSIMGMAIGVGFMVFLILSGIYSSAKFNDGVFMGAIQAWMIFKWSMSWTIHLYHYHILGMSSEHIKNRLLREEQTPWNTPE